MTRPINVKRGGAKQPDSVLNDTCITPAACFYASEQ